MLEKNNIEVLTSMLEKCWEEDARTSCFLVVSLFDWVVRKALVSFSDPDDSTKDGSPESIHRVRINLPEIKKGWDNYCRPEFDFEEILKENAATQNVSWANVVEAYRGVCSLSLNTENRPVVDQAFKHAKLLVNVIRAILTEAREAVINLADADC